MCENFLKDFDTAAGRVAAAAGMAVLLQVRQRALVIRASNDERLGE